ncbi:DUF4249 domain-containing protein [Larkinella rosea]|nr:DUF4249 domain-containing protein [Larkinella rosea]
MVGIGNNVIRVVLVVLFLAGSCVDPYRPPEISAPNKFLVVDGFLNGLGISTVRLSRTQNLTENKKPPVETRAIVQVEDEKGTGHTFVDQGDGTYTLEQGRLQMGQTYRLKIQTAAGRNYASDYVTIKRTPPIDDLSWKAREDGVQFYVSTHDETNNTRYYRWEYEETWEYYSAYYSQFKYLKTQFLYREDNINHCWRTDKSNSVSVATSDKLSQDVIARFPLTFVSASASNRLKVRYSILVKQYALTAEAFDYWQNLKKNTEMLGSLFDPQPFQAAGNIHGITDPDEPVVGYLNSHSMEEKRVFIESSELPSWRIPNGYEACEADTYLLKPPPTEVSAVAMGEAGFIPIDAVLNSIGNVHGYRMASPACVDCRVVGTNVKPSFW